MSEGQPTPSLDRPARRRREREERKHALRRAGRATETNLEQPRATASRLWLRALVFAPVLAVSLGLGFGASHLMASRNAPPPELKGVETFEGLSRNHVPKPSFLERPPVGGDHASVWQNCGVYRTPITDATAVHSLEHGAVWITYHPMLEKRAVKTLERFVMGKPYLILSPYPGLVSAVQANAWGVRLRLPAADVKRLEVFVKHYVNHDKVPEKEWMCVGGTGKPVWEKQKPKVPS